MKKKEEIYKIIIPKRLMGEFAIGIVNGILKKEIERKAKSKNRGK